MSAGASSARRSLAFDAGADDYFEKPIAARELRSKAANILDRHATLRKQFREQVIVRPAEVSTRSIDQKFIQKVTSAIESSIADNHFSVQELGDAVAMSTSQLTRKLKALIDQTPAQLIRRARLQRAADLIAADAGQLAEICFQVGFSDQSHFSRSFKKHFGMSPKNYREQNKAGLQDG
jgi:AraC-like DNA-binding protein